MERWFLYRKIRFNLMLYPLFISPSFIKDMGQNEIYQEKFLEFYRKFEEVWTDIFVLIDDDKNSIIESYKNIYKSESVLSNPRLKGLIDIILTLKRYKYTNLKTGHFDDISNFLKQKGVENIVEFPNYFDDQFINIKKLQPKISLIKTTYNKVIEEICSITRFSKKVFLNDAMLPYSLTNIQNAKSVFELSNDPTEFKKIKNKKIVSDFILKKNYRYYQFSLKELVRNIYEKNFFQDELEIYIYTTLHNSKIYNLYSSVKYFDSESVERWNNIGQFISESIKKCIINSEEPSTNCVKDVIIKQHFKDNKKIYGKNTINFEIYDRSIFVLDLNSAIELRKGLDIFDEESESGLRSDSGYYIRNYLDDDELESARQILEHPNYVAKEVYIPKNIQP